MSNVNELWLSALRQADANNTQKPLLSQRFNLQDMDVAYAIQTKYVAWKIEQGNSIFGYKAALTAAAGQKLFGVDGPGSGVLFTSGKRCSGDCLMLADFHRPAFEVEIAYRVDSAITEPVTRDAVMSLVGEILPMVEVVDFGYADSEGQQEDMHAVDLMAGNSASAQFIVGKFETFDGEVNSLKTSLSRDGKQLLSGQGSDALGDQLESLVFLINQTLALHYPIRPGHYFMTGALGGMFFAEPGHYIATYGECGQILFSCE